MHVVDWPDAVGPNRPAWRNFDRATMKKLRTLRYALPKRKTETAAGEPIRLAGRRWQPRLRRAHAAAAAATGE